MKAKCILFVLCWTTCFIQNARGARILGIFPLPAKSHSIIYEAVMEALAGAGHQVDIVSHFVRKKPYPNYTDIIDLSQTMPVVVNNMTYEYMQYFRSLSVKTLAEIAGVNMCNLMEFPDVQKLIKNPPTNPPYDLVIVEYFFASCYFAFGRHLNVPVIGITSSATYIHSNEPLGNPLNPAIVSEIKDRPASPMNYWQRLKNTIYILSYRVQAKYYMRNQNAIVKKHFGPDMPDIDQLQRELSLLLVNSHPIIHGVRPITPAVVEIGGGHIRDDNLPIPTELEKWLDDSKNGFIFFSLGSMVKVESFPTAALAELYSAFVKVAPIRILMKVASPEELPPGLPDNVFTSSWVPQVQVLKHKNIRGFMTHGGLLGLEEALTFAVPLIGIPLFADHLGNVDICVHKGIAIFLDYQNLKADEIAAAIQTVTNDPKYKINMKAISKQFLDQPVNPRDTAVFWIEYILKHGPDALRSPAVDLAWWQLALLDVYGTIIAAVLIILYVFKRILSALFGLIFNRNEAFPHSKKQN